MIKNTSKIKVNITLICYSMRNLICEQMSKIKTYSNYIKYNV